MIYKLLLQALERDKSRIPWMAAVSLTDHTDQHVNVSLHFSHRLSAIRHAFAVNWPNSGKIA
jgi:hypothetical protein